MKKALKLIFKILLVPYLLIVIFLTICLLNYNENKLTVLGDQTFIIVKDSSLSPKYEKGDLVVVSKTPNKDIAVNDDIFFYETYEAETSVNLGAVKAKTDITKKETTYTMSGDYDLSSEFVIGKAATSKRYKTLGGILGFLESKWGFLFFIVLPILIAFLYEIYAIFIEVKDEVKSSKKRKD